VSKSHFQVKGFVAEKAAVCLAIGDCRALAQRTLFDVLKAKGCQLTRHPPVAAKDLAPPPVCAQQLNALLELLHSPDASMLPEEEVCVNPTQVCVNPTQVCVNPT
jgi:hypothetical protein